MLGGFLVWWYGDGLNDRFRSIAERLARVSDYFSVGLLAATLFTPFRQLSVGKVNGPLGTQIRAFFDNLVSRVIGAFVRLVTMGIALLASVGVLLYGVVVLIVWLILPLLPLGGVALTIAGGHS